MIHVDPPSFLCSSQKPADTLIRTCDETLRLTRKVCRGIASADKRIKALGGDPAASLLAQETNRLFFEVLILRNQLEKIQKDLKKARSPLFYRLVQRCLLVL